MAIDNRITREASDDLASLCYMLDTLRKHGAPLSDADQEQIDRIINRLTDVLRDLFVLRGKLHEAVETHIWER